jgi:hypothetical protein
MRGPTLKFWKWDRDDLPYGIAAFGSLLIAIGGVFVVLGGLFHAW